MLGIVNILLGIGLLVAGRKLFWLFIAAMGFVAGAQLVIRAWNGPEWMALVVGIVVGLLFAGLATILKSLVIGIAGFLAGGSILYGLAGIFGLDSGAYAWIIYIVGGVIGIILVSQLFDWAIIILSSLGGATLLTQATSLKAAPAVLTFIVLVIVGIIIQIMELRRNKDKPHER
jgi:ammonia channel protein AmtB